MTHIDVGCPTESPMNREMREKEVVRDGSSIGIRNKRGCLIPVSPVSYEGGDGTLIEQTNRVGS